ncbi:MAG: hypothetical protein R2932_60235 [Caldilineaceae bacterium]
MNFTIGLGTAVAGEVTLAQCLSRAGWLFTCGVSTPFMVRNGYGHDRGFGDIIYVRGQGDAERIDVNMWRRAGKRTLRPALSAQAVIGWSAITKSSFSFTWTLRDPHEPWDSPHHYVTPYLSDYQGEIIIPPCYWDYAEDGITAKKVGHCPRLLLWGDQHGGSLVWPPDGAGAHARAAGKIRQLFFSPTMAFTLATHGQFGKRRFRWPDNLPFEQGFLLGRTLADGWHLPLAAA